MSKIPYVEIINKTTLKPFELIEPSECWFELSYYEVGEFEIYCVASQKNLASLQKGNYVKIPNKNYLWVITSIKYEFKENTRMISAKGYEAKWLVSKRIIKEPLELSTSLDNAIFNLVTDNLGVRAPYARRIQKLVAVLSGINITIGPTQATRGNLLEFISTLLKENKCGCQIKLINGSLVFSLIKGADKTETVKFSQSLDNLLSSSYSSNEEELRTYAQVVSTVEDVDYTQEYDTGAVGIDRSEILVNSNLSTKYKNASGVEQETTPTSLLYQGWQIEEGKNELTKHITKEDVNGEIDLINSSYEFDVDFTLGDRVGVQDEYFNFSINSRVLKYTISQDASGYAESADYGE